MLTRGIEDDILDTCRELGIGITAYGVLSRGLIGSVAAGFQGDDVHAAGRDSRAGTSSTTWRSWRGSGRSPAQGLTVAQLAIAWVAAQGSDVVPLVGMKSRHACSRRSTRSP